MGLGFDEMAKLYRVTTLENSLEEWPHDFANSTALLMRLRQTVLPKRSIAPGPNAAQLHLILHAAASAPITDSCCLGDWW